MMWNCWSTAPLPQGPSDPWTPGPEKSLQDCNHKWITADTRVPDGGKEISTCINEEETLWAVYQVIKKIKRVVWLKYKIKKNIYIYTHHWQLQAFFAVTEVRNTNKIEQHRHIISLWWVWVVVGFWLVGLGLRNFLPLFYKWWCYSKATQETLAWERWPVREHKILLRQHHSPGTQQGRGWAGGLVENWQCDHGTAHWARRQDGQIKPFQTGFNLIFPNLWAKTFQSHFSKFVFHLWLLLKHPPTWISPAFPSTALWNVKLHIPKAQTQEPLSVINLDNLHHLFEKATLQPYTAVPACVRSQTQD